MSLLDALLLEPHRINLWLAIRTDGNKGSGTQSDPFEASAEDRFDALLNSFDEFTTVHLGPGTFKTRGYSDDDSASGWQPKRGMKIFGSGMDVTTLQLVGSGGNDRHYFAIGHKLAIGSDPGVQVDFFEASDLTIDCNLMESGGSSFARGAVRIKGNHARLRRLKAINWGTKTSQKTCYVFALITGDPEALKPVIEDAGIEQCVAINPASGAGVLEPATLFHTGGKEEVAALKEVYGLKPFIRNCYADAGQTTPSSKDFRALSMGWCRGGEVQGNEIRNCKIGGPYQEKTSARDIIVRNNSYYNVCRGPYWNLGTLHPATPANLTSLVRDPDDHTIAVATTSLPDHGLQPGERVKVSASGPSQFAGVFIIKGVPAANQFRYQMLSAPTQDASGGTFQKVIGINRLLVENNSIELAGGDEGELGIHLHDGNLANQEPDHVHGEIMIRNNKISYVDAVFDSSYEGTGMAINGAKNLTVEDNTVEVTADPIQNERCGAVRYFDNRTPSGALLPGMNPDTGRAMEELDAAAEDALVAALYQRH